MQKQDGPVAMAFSGGLDTSGNIQPFRIDRDSCHRHASQAECGACERKAGILDPGSRRSELKPEARPDNGRAVDFVVESDRAQLSEIVQRVRDGRLRTNIGNVSTLDDAVAALNPTGRRKGKTVIRVRP